jgi:small subunit ribosomal protein S4e
MHIKRKTIPNFWPIQRSGSKYMAVPTHNQAVSMPMIIVLRDILKLVKTKKELKKIVNEKKINVNGKAVKELNYPLSLFDTLSMPSVKKSYRAVLASKRMSFEEIKESEAGTRVYKVIGKKTLPGKKVQINLNNGKNLLTSEKISSGDFVEIDNLKNKILKIIPLAKETKVIAIAGKHMGKSGKIKEIVTEGGNTIAKIKTDKEEISANVKNLFALN